MTRNPCKPLSLLSAALMLTLAAPITTYATEAGDWLVHIRALNVNPDDDSDEITLDGAKLAGSEAHVEDGWTLGIDTTYMMTANWGVTLMLDLSSQHSISVNVPALGGDQGKIGDVRVLPPSLLLQYHFLPKSSFQPYVGAGVNYTIFFDEGTKDS